MKNLLKAATAASLALIIGVGAPLAAFADEPIEPPVEVIETETPAETPDDGEAVSTPDAEEETAPAESEASEGEEGEPAPAEAPAPAPAAVGVTVFDGTLGYLFPRVDTTPRVVDFDNYVQGMGAWNDWSFETSGISRSNFSGTLPQLTMLHAGPGVTSFQWRLANSLTSEVTDWATLTAAASEPLFEGAPLYWSAPVADYQLADQPAGLGAETFGRTAVAPFVSKPLSRTQVWELADAVPDLGRAGVYTWDLGTATTVSYGSNSGLPVATAAYRYLEPQSEVGINLAEMFPELGLTGFYVPGASTSTGELVSGDLGCANASNTFSCANAFATEGASFIARGTGDGVVFDLSTVPWASIGHYAEFGVDVVGFSGGVQVPLRVNLTFALYGGQPGIQDLQFSVPVGQTLSIPTSALEASISWNSGEERSVSVEGLPVSVVPTADGFEYMATAPAVESFGFRGTERQRPAGFVDSQSGTVTILAFEGDEEPAAVAPTLADFAFASPLPKGDPETSTGGSRIPIETLTEGIDWATAGWNDWYVEIDGLPVDFPLNVFLPDGFELFPAEDGLALSFRIRLVNTADPSVTSNWATVTAPAAAVVEPPVVVEPPAVTPPVVTPPTGAPREVPERVQTGDQPVADMRGMGFTPLVWLILALAGAAGYRRRLSE